MSITGETSRVRPQGDHLMSTSPYFISKLLKVWRNSGKERDLMLMLLDKPSDHLLRDVGMTREALYITGLCHL
jgi:uncharacterized protein YjiS (DUF1127 family)